MCLALSHSRTRRENTGCICLAVFSSCTPYVLCSQVQHLLILIGSKPYLASGHALILPLVVHNLHVQQEPAAAIEASIANSCCAWNESLPGLTGQIRCVNAKGCHGSI